MNIILTTAINSITCSDELNEAITLIKIKQKQLRANKIRTNKSAIGISDAVKISSRNGIQYGVVQKIRRTTATVNIDGVAYDCPIAILSPA